MVISYDSTSSHVWIDALGTGGSGQLLCEQHRARLTPPRGWTVVDRRPTPAPAEPPASRAPRPAATATPPRVAAEPVGETAAEVVPEPAEPGDPVDEPPVVRPARRRRRTWGRLEPPRLEFSGPEIEVGRVAPRPVEPEPLPEPDPLQEPASAPPPVVEPEPVREPGPAAAPAAPTREAAPEPEPLAEEQPADDIAALLQPKGGLLAQAFRSTGPQRSVLTEVLTDEPTDADPTGADAEASETAGAPGPTDEG